jgi:hypothetical protein
VISNKLRFHVLHVVEINTIIAKLISPCQTDACVRYFAHDLQRGSNAHAYYTCYTAVGAASELSMLGNQGQYHWAKSGAPGTPQVRFAECGKQFCSALVQCGMQISPGHTHGAAFRNAAVGDKVRPPTSLCRAKALELN